MYVKKTREQRTKIAWRLFPPKKKILEKKEDVIHRNIVSQAYLLRVKLHLERTKMPG
jgi:hypothetical protein